jgi:cytosine permease
MMFGWFAVNVGVAGAATGQLLGVPERVGMVVFAAGMLAITWRGIGALSWAALATATATVVLAAWGLHLAAARHGLTITSPRTATQPTSILAGASLVVGFGAAFALRTPDFTYALQRRRQVLWCGLVGLLAPIIAFGIAGATLLAAAGTWNLADVLTALGSPTPAYLFLAVGFAGSVMTNLYSGALSLSDAVPAIPHHVGLVVVAVGGTAAAASGFADHMIGYLVVMAIAAPSLGVLCLIAWRRQPDRGRRWRPAGIVAWGVSMGAGLVLHAAGSGRAAAASVTIAALLGFVAVGRVGQTSPPSSLTRRTHGDRHG